MTALSRRIEIFVFPGSGFTTAPRLAREKSMSRYFSAPALRIGSPLALVRLPGRNQPDDVGFLLRVDDDEQVCQVAQAQRHESRLVNGSGILASKGEVVLQDRRRFREAHTVRS